MVVIAHLLEVPVIGGLAVGGFFVLSGFLMTTIMQETYGYTASGLKRFAANRFLRLYPPYWLACAISLAVIAVCGAEHVKNYRSFITVPQGAFAVLTNATMIFPDFFPQRVSPRLSPATWALTVELFYYLLIALGISKTFRRTSIWLLLSVVYMVATLLLRLPSEWRYFAIPAGSLPFALGALLYFRKDAIHAFLKRIPGMSSESILLAFIALCAGLSLAPQTRLNPLLEEIGPSLSLGLSALLIVQLYYNGLSSIPRRLDKLIGDYSYPTYLLHWQLGAFASWLLYAAPVRGPSWASAGVFLSDLALVAVVGAFSVFALDPVIERLRSRIKGGRKTQKIGPLAYAPSKP
jgi:peptidoglycan/LPS O-acetylase OafA/YrhL